MLFRASWALLGDLGSPQGISKSPQDAPKWATDVAKSSQDAFLIDFWDVLSIWFGKGLGKSFLR